MSSDLLAALAGLRERAAAHAVKHDECERDWLEHVEALDAIIDQARVSELKEPPAPVWAWPTDHRVVTQHFGDDPAYYHRFNMRSLVHPPHDGHEGLDIRSGLRGPIYAIAGGDVIVAGWHKDRNGSNGAYGVHVRILHNPDLRSVYAHLEDSLLVRVGQSVKAGQQLGYSGNTGNIRGQHLHLNVQERIGGAWLCVDPEKYIGELVK